MKHLIMVVEDEEALALLLKYNLEKEGYDVIVDGIVGPWFLEISFKRGTRYTISF